MGRKHVPTIITDNPTMSSREIAERTGKLHRNVKADMTMLWALGEDALKFQHIQRDAMNRRDVRSMIRALAEDESKFAFIYVDSRRRLDDLGGGERKFASTYRGIRRMLDDLGEGEI